MGTNTDSPAGGSGESAGRAPGEKFDPRTPRRQMIEAVETWSFILGLSTMAIVWALIALHTIGNTTMHKMDYFLPNTTPASHATIDSEIP